MKAAPTGDQNRIRARGHAGYKRPEGTSKLRCGGPATRRGPRQDDQPLAARSFLALAATSFTAASSLPLWPVVCSRSEEHTSELQSLMRISYAVFCLKKKKETIEIKLITKPKIKRQSFKQHLTSRHKRLLKQKHTY